MRIPKLEFQKYIDSKYEECLELFELNCPTYFAEEERKDYRQFLEHDRDFYLLGYENGSLICCFGITEHNKDLCSLSWIMVHPKHHKSGFGNEMMSYFISYAREKNKFLSKYETLSNEKAKIARSQPINQEILSSSQSI